MSRNIPYREVAKAMKKNGWVLDHTTGSHEDGKMCPVKCDKKVMKNGTLSSIERITRLKF